MWRLHGVPNDLMCVSVVTPSDCRLLLELDGEPMLLELRCRAKDLTKKAGRLAAWLAAQGWQPFAGR